MTFDSMSSNFARLLSVALGERDALTRAHSERVATLAVGIGRECGLEERELVVLWLAGAMHDVGKIGIPDRILRKPGQLDETERERMQTHSAIGEKIVLAVPLPGMDQVAVAVRHHHERYDGSGYPDGLAKDRIPLFSRIVGLADAYDATTAARPYHAPREHPVSLEMLRADVATKHDPWVYARFEAFLLHREVPSVRWDPGVEI